jgi:hypothetical protein
MRTKRSNRNLIALWVALGAVACGESGGGPASDAAAAGGTTPDASPNTDAASGGAATADATSAPEVDVGAAPEADASLPPDAGPQASAECLEACSHVVGCFTQTEPQVCACAGSTDPGAIQDACLSQCNALLVSTVGRTATCPDLAATMSTAYPALRPYCGLDGECPEPPPPHFGGPAPADLDPACVAFADRVVQCTTEACPGLADYTDGFARQMWEYCRVLVQDPLFDTAEPKTLEAIRAVAELPCEAPEVQELVLRRITADRQFAVGPHLAEFCAHGPLAPEETCRAACERWAECASSDPEQCEFGCVVDAMNSAHMACAASTSSCDELPQCDSSTGVDRETPTLLANFPADDCRNSNIMPAPGEEGHLVATRLTPPSYPWRVDAIQYANLANVNSQSNCSTAFDERVEVSVMDADVPAAEPMPVAVIPVEGVDLPLDTVRMVEVQLPEPIVLQAGQHLLVGVSLSGTFPDVSCVLGCRWRVAQPNRFFWSNAVSAPYDWAELSRFGITNEYWMFAVGAPVE